MSELLKAVVPVGSGYTVDQLRPLIERFGNPVVLSQDNILVAVNEAYLSATGFKRALVEGQHYERFIPPEEIQPLAERVRRREAGELKPAEVMILRVNALDVDGVRRPWIIYVSEIPAAAGGSYVLSSCSEVPGAERDLTLAEYVVKLAASLAAARTEEEARDAVVSGFRAFGVPATIARVQDDDSVVLLCADSDALPPSAQFYREAIASRRPMYVLPPGTQTYTVYIPVLRGDAPAELLILWNAPFETLHLSLLTLFARQLAATLESTRRLGELGQRNHELSLLLDLARTMSGTLDLSTILDVASDFVVRLLDVSNCFILLLNDKRTVLNAVASSSAHRGYFRNVVIDMSSQSVSAQAVRERRPVMIEDTLAASAIMRRDLVDRFGEKAILAVPMLVRNEPIGAIVVDDTRAPRKFSPELLSLAEATASQLALSVKAAQLYESLKESYAQLATTRAEMVKQERLAALGELSAIVAHEVRNPLGVIFNAVASLRRVVTPKDPDAAMLLEIVKEECERLNRIVSDLLDFSRPMGLSLEQEDLGALINESIATAVAGAGLEATWQIDTQIEPELPHVVVDREALRQALMNVVINALQAMPRGGRVQVTAVREGVSAVRIDVKDEGGGVPADIRARIFEPFFTTKAKGTGLGLAVVKRILEDHQGEVSLASQPGHGATFSFRLPIKEDAKATPTHS